MNGAGRGGVRVLRALVFVAGVVDPHRGGPRRRRGELGAGRPRRDRSAAVARRAARLGLPASGGPPRSGPGPRPGGGSPRPRAPSRARRRRRASRCRASPTPPTPGTRWPGARPARRAMQMAGLTGDAGAMLAPSGWMVAPTSSPPSLTALVLARGEQVLWQVLDLVLPPLPELLPRVAAATTSGPVRPARPRDGQRHGPVRAGATRQRPPDAPLPGRSPDPVRPAPAGTRAASAPPASPDIAGPDTVPNGTPRAPADPKDQP